MLELHENWEANLEYVDEFKPEIFEFELNAWYCDPQLWPEARSVEFIDRWLRIELHSMLIDLERGRIKKRGGRGLGPGKLEQDQRGRIMGTHR